MASLALLCAPATAAPEAPAAAPGDACADALDAEQRGDVFCRSPGAVDPARVVAADAVPAEPPPLRDPAMFTSEIGFFAIVSAAAGAGAVAYAVITDTPNNTPTDEALRQGSFYAGLGGLGLATGLGAAALSTFVFDVSQGTLRLALFDDEDH